VSCDHLHDSGPYVLGALSPREREDYERHLATCPECRAEVAELADLPLLLGRLDLNTAQAISAGGPDAMHAVLENMPEAEPPTPPPHWAGPAHPPPFAPAVNTGSRFDPLLPRVLDRAKAQRRSDRRRGRLKIAGVALVAACLAVAAVFGVQAALRPHLAPMTPIAGRPPVTASLALTAVGDGTQVRMHCEYENDRDGHPQGQHWGFQLVAISRSGQPTDLGWWTATYGDKYDLTGHTGLKKSDIQRVEIRNANGQPLLVYELA
jgi:hypothetical protein